MIITLYTDDRTPSRRITARIGARTLVVEQHDLGEGIEEEYTVTMPKGALLRVLGLADDDALAQHLQARYASARAVDALIRLAEKRNIPHEVSSY